MTGMPDPSASPVQDLQPPSPEQLDDQSYKEPEKEGRYIRQALLRLFKKYPSMIEVFCH